MDTTDVKLKLMEKGLGDKGCMPTLSFRERLTYFMLCLVIGFSLTILSMISLSLMQLPAFAVLYSVGSLVSLSGSGFLFGFKKQAASMFAPKRLVATIVYLASVVATLVAALFLGSAILCILFLIIQFGAYYWYIASYIPGGRNAISFICKGVFKSATSS